MDPIAPTDPYLASTQHRLFSYTPAQLSDLRVRTNGLAVARHREDLRRAIAAGDAPSLTIDSSADNSGANTPLQPGSHAAPGAAGGMMTTVPAASAYPTAEEELKILTYYCLNALQIAEQIFHFPSAIKAQALVYLSRLYLTTSCITIHPKKMILPALHLATKTENYYTAIPEFIKTATAGGLKVTHEELVKPEITLAMGLQWSFTAWHPARGLEGMFLELAAIEGGFYEPPQAGPKSGVALTARYRERFARDWEGRAGRATDRAKDILMSRALITDVYFLYTPAQITLAGLWTADAELAAFYMEAKFTNHPDPAVRDTVVAVVKECATQHLDEGGDSHAGLLLRMPSNNLPMSAEDVTEGFKRDLRTIDKKLHMLNKPLREVRARHADQGLDGDEERKAKKRRLEKEKSVMDDVFGGALPGQG